MINSSPKPGDIGLVPIFGFVGWIIRILQWFNGDSFTKYTHAFIVLEDGMLIEGQPGGAVINPLSEYDDRDVVYVSPAGLTYADRKRICDEALAFKGVEYSFIDYAAIAAHRFRLPIPGLRTYIASTGHQICSQLCDAAYRRAGVRLFSDGRWSGYVTPGSLYRNPVLV